jgi:hypothetical protein
MAPRCSIFVRCTRLEQLRGASTSKDIAMARSGRRFGPLFYLTLFAALVVALSVPFWPTAIVQGRAWRLSRQLLDADPATRQEAAQSLVQLGPTATSWVIRAMHDDNPRFASLHVPPSCVRTQTILNEPRTHCSPRAPTAMPRFAKPLSAKWSSGFTSAQRFLDPTSQSAPSRRSDLRSPTARRKSA